MTMGLGLRTDIPNGLVGIGYAVNEAIVGTTQSLKSVYPNLPVNMVDEGLINTIAYSLWLNDLGTSCLAPPPPLRHAPNTPQTRAPAASSSAASTQKNTRAPSPASKSTPPKTTSSPPSSSP